MLVAEILSTERRVETVLAQRMTYHILSLMHGTFASRILTPTICSNCRDKLWFFPLLQDDCPLCGVIVMEDRGAVRADVSS
jgi:hypothetical protein